LDHIEQTDDIEYIILECQELTYISEWDNNHTIKLNEIDKQITKLLLESESTLSVNSSIPWSPKMHESFLTYTYWRKYNSSKKNRTKLDLEMADIKRQIGNKVYMNQHINRNSMQLLRIATKLWQECKQEAYEMRQQHLYERQELAIRSNNPDVAKIISNLRKSERIKRAYQHIKILNKPNTSNGGLSYILTKNDDGSLQRIDNIDDMNEKLYHRNRIHFSQAHNTPCTLPATVKHIGESGTTDTARNILRGQIPEDMNADLKMIFQELQTNTVPVPLDYDLNDMIQGFSAWPEQTTTSPSGRHLGIYKALSNAHKYKIRTSREEAIAASTAKMQTRTLKIYLPPKSYKLLIRSLILQLRIQSYYRDGQ
jgi:hypothetical protein